MNNKRILEKVQMKIAISNSNKEDIVMGKNKMQLVKSIGIAVGILLSMSGVAFAATQLISKFGPNSSGGVEIAVENEYVANVNTEYKNSNGISASVDSFLLDDNNFDIIFNLKFDDTYNLNEMLSKGHLEIMDLKVLNEKNEKVFATHDLESEEKRALYKTPQEAREKYDSYSGAYSFTIEKVNENEIKLYLTATGNSKPFPASQKLYITFNRICLIELVGEEFKYTIYQGQWSYEIDVPLQMSKSNIVEYKLVSISDKDYQLESAKVSNTAFKIYLNNCKDISYSDNECVETAGGNKFYPAHRSDGDGGISVGEDGIVKYYNTFNLTNFDATDTIKVHLFKTTGEEVVIELMKVK